MKDIIKNEFNAHIKAANLLHNLTDAVATSAQLCIDCLRNGGKILIFGNGGSAADAQHIAAELVGRYKTNRKGLSAIALTTDTSSLTAIGNDFGYKYIFSKQLSAIGKKGDVLFAISTSGKSENIIEVLKIAKQKNIKTILMTGNEIKEKTNCDIVLNVPAKRVDRIQEMHILVGHTICELIENEI